MGPTEFLHGKAAESSPDVCVRAVTHSLKATFVNIWNAAKDLPIPIRRICYVQLFAWSGYFP